MKCTFQVRFSRRQSDGLFVLSKLSTKHSGVRRSSWCADGRHQKQRRNVRLDDVVERVLQIKEGIPVPGDVIKTSASMNNTQVQYMVARRALNDDVFQ